MTRPEAEVRVRREEVTAAAADVDPLNKALADAGARLEPLFGMSEERLRMATAEPTPTGLPAPDLSVFYRVDAEGDLEALAHSLLESEAVEAAYVVPPAELAQEEGINDMTPAEEDAPPATADFGGRQGYLDRAPGGIDARFAWTVPGGEGAGVNVIDIEGAWRFTHEDLRALQGGVIGGVQTTSLAWRNHGTAVIGEISGDRNAIGILGIAPSAFVRGVSIFDAQGRQNSANAIRQAADALSPGGVILIELHRPGPRARNDGTQFGFIAIEWWEQDFAAISYATSRGVIVVEAAGNGSQNLDDPIYNTPLAGFPSGWRNPFNRANRDSRAVVVGAGAPPPGTHGRDHGPDRSRLDFSNWGSMVDAQGWGREVTTTGYGDLQGGTNEDLWYTDRFSGTSSASPIVVGAVACLQGVARARSRPLLTPLSARQLLRTTGSPQQDASGRPATQRIGNRPDLRAAIPRVIKPKEKDKEKNDVKDRKDLKDDAKDKELTKEKELNKDKEKDKEVTKENKDSKDQKDRKDKEKELKEEKDRKDQLKDKEKEKEKEKDKEKEVQKDTKDRKERKDLKDDAKDKELTKEKEQDAFFGVGPLEERVSRLEQTVAQLKTFIGPELRPDLMASALSDEPDVGAFDPSAASQALGAAGEQAKQIKDDKDVEKLSDG
jgi:subtilisin family serine protease